ncbi:MAG: ankyrin repeat domain-containing protein [Candidatus Binatia bacterium]
MYTSYFGLRELPFSLSNDLHFFYPTPLTTEVEEEIVSAVRERKGLLLLTGVPGTGKTTILRRITSTVDETIHIISPPFSTLNFHEILTYLCEHLDLQVTHSDPFTKVLAIQDHLRTWSQHGRIPLLCIDEAQNLSKETLDRLRLFLHLKGPHGRLLQILLIGQPQLEAKLTHPDLRHIQQYVALHCHLTPLSPDAVHHFIQHRLRIAGCENSRLFTPEAIEKIVRYSQAVPQLINVLCDNVLIAAYMAGHHTVSHSLVDEVAQNLQLPDETTAKRELSHPTPPVSFSATSPAPVRKSRLIQNLAWAGIGFFFAWLSSVQQNSPLLISEFFRVGSSTTSFVAPEIPAASSILPSSSQGEHYVSHSDPHMSPAPQPSPQPVIPVLQQQQDKTLRQQPLPTGKQSTKHAGSQQEKDSATSVETETRLASTQPVATLPSQPKRSDSSISLPLESPGKEQEQRLPSPEQQHDRYPQKQKKATEAPARDPRIQPRPTDYPPRNVRRNLRTNARTVLAQRHIRPTSQALMAAAAAGDLQLVDLLLTAEVSPNARGNQGWTALMQAARANHLAVVQLLLRRGAHVDTKNTAGETALFHAANNNHIEVVYTLLDHGASINARSNQGWTPLMYAAWRGHRQTVEALLNKGADARVKDRTGRTASMYAARQGRTSIYDLQFRDHMTPPYDQLSHFDKTKNQLVRRQDYSEIASILKQAETQP